MCVCIRRVYDTDTFIVSSAEATDQPGMPCVSGVRIICGCVIWGVPEMGISGISQNGWFIHGKSING